MRAMNWYYAENGTQKGPLTDWDFASQARSGIIKPDTLVWRDGLPEWKPLIELRPDLAAGADAPSLGGMAVPEQNKDLMVQQMREGVLPGQLQYAANPYGFQYAGFWIRVAAWLIDYIVTLVAVYAIGFLMLGTLIFGIGFDPAKMEKDPAATAGIMIAYFAFIGISLLLPALYKAFMVSKWDATLGKMAVGLKVVRADGSKVSFKCALGRGFADIINGFACSLTYLMVAFDEPERRSLQDHICGTRVIVK
jgi:uncharacterized RDD family membrane protein YckC